MSGMLPPKRSSSSLEMTAVRPLASLAPVSMAVPATVEQIDDCNPVLQDDVETLVSCPECERCPVCGGAHMVSAERAAEWRRQRAIAADEAMPIIDSPPDEAA